MYVDGVLKAQVDTYSASPQAQVVLLYDQRAQFRNAYTGCRGLRDEERSGSLVLDLG